MRKKKKKKKQCQLKIDKKKKMGGLLAMVSDLTISHQNECIDIDFGK